MRGPYTSLCFLLGAMLTHHTFINQARYQPGLQITNKLNKPGTKSAWPTNRNTNEKQGELDLSGTPNSRNQAQNQTGLSNITQCRFECPQDDARNPHPSHRAFHSAKCPEILLAMINRSRYGLSHPRSKRYGGSRVWAGLPKTFQMFNLPQSKLNR